MRLGRVRKVLTDATGVPLAGVSVRVLDEGALVDGAHGGGAGPYSVTVHSPGSFRAGSVARIEGDDATSYTVDSVTATSVVLLGTIPAIADGKRLYRGAGIGTLFSDGNGDDAISNPLTTDAAGVAEAYCNLGSGVVDLYIFGGSPSITPVLLKSVPLTGGDIRKSRILAGLGSSVPAHVFDTLSALVSGDRIFEIRNAGTSKAYFDHEGGLHIVGDPAGVAFEISAGGDVPLKDSAGTNYLFWDDSVNTLFLGGTAHRVEFQGRFGLNGSGGVGVVTLDANWGVGASHTVRTGSHAYGGWIDVTAAGTPGADPTVLITFPVFPGVNRVSLAWVRNITDDNGHAPVEVYPTTPGTPEEATWSQFYLKYKGTPTAGKTYRFTWLTL